MLRLFFNGYFLVIASGAGKRQAGPRKNFFWQGIILSPAFVGDLRRKDGKK